MRRSAFAISCKNSKLNCDEFTFRQNACRAKAQFYKNMILSNPTHRHFLSVHIVSTFFVYSLRLANFVQVFVLGVFYSQLRSCPLHDDKSYNGNKYRRITFFRIAKIKQMKKVNSLHRITTAQRSFLCSINSFKQILIKSGPTIEPNTK